MFKLCSTLAVVAFAASTSIAAAGTIKNVEIWDAIGNMGTTPTGEGVLENRGGSQAYMPSVLDVINSRAADATFTSSGLNYAPLSGVRLPDATFADFLGADAASIISDDSNFANRSLLGSVFRVTGKVLLDAGENIFKITSDDGFRLTVGDTVGSFNRLRGPGSFTNVTVDGGAGGFLDFELIYFEAMAVQAQLRAELNGEVITDIAPVPLPAGLPLLLGGIAVFGGLRLRKKRLG